MAVLTLSWQIGCRGDYIAKDVAHQLGYRIIGKHELHEMLVNASDHVSKELRTDESLKTVEEEIQPDFFFRLHRRDSTYANLLISLICNAACQDNVIIKGYGAHFVLAKKPHVLCVRLQGSLDFRVSSIQEQRHLDYRTAKKLVLKDDRERMGFVQYLFQRELTDVQWYDIIIDVGKLNQQVITEMLVSATRFLAETHVLTEEDRKSLQALALGSRIKAVIQKTIPDIPGLEVDASTNGTVKISGNVVRKTDKALIGQQVSALPEVQKVVNQIKVGAPFRRNKKS